MIAGCKVGAGVVITGAGATANRVLGNLIGTDLAGALPHPNGRGVVVSEGASGNVIGGAEAGARNVISGNDTVGVAVNTASDNRVLGNFIGTDRTGLLPLPNGQPGGLYGAGVELGANVGAGQTPTTGNWVGGSAPGEGNVISGNANLGVSLFGLLTASNRVQGNFIGTDATGTKPLGNGLSELFPRYGGAGVSVAAAGIEGNLIGGRPGSGAGNLIGWNGRGSNFHAGVISFGTNTLVEGNTIVSNKGPGVAFAAPTRVLGNSIYGNTGLGIDRGNDGPTPNTPGGEFNSPEILSATQGSVVIKFKHTGKPGCLYLLEFFFTSPADASGNPAQPSAKVKLGAQIIESGATGVTEGEVTFDGDYGKGGQVTCTVTSSCADYPETSELAPGAALKPRDTPPVNFPGCVSFGDQSLLVCRDGNGRVVASLSRTPDSQGRLPAASVTVKTSAALADDGTKARPGIDYAEASQRVTFAEGSKEALVDFFAVIPRDIGGVSVFRLRFEAPDGVSVCTEMSGSLLVTLVRCNPPASQPIVTQPPDEPKKVQVSYTDGIITHGDKVNQPLSPVLNPEYSVVLTPDDPTYPPEQFIQIVPVRPPPKPEPGQVTDHGDAPFSYDQLHMPGGLRFLQSAGHRYVPGAPNPFLLGAARDAELLPQWTPDAQGDDINLPDDEDGVVWHGPLVAGVLTTVDVTASRPGFLDLWIDYDFDGSFLDPFPKPPAFPRNYVNPAIFGNAGGGPLPLKAGVNHVQFYVPNVIRSVLSFARFRFSAGGLGTPLGIAQEGEVEDYRVQLHDLLTDFGDAPDSLGTPGYPTLLAHNGAFHLTTVADFYLGASLDYETDGHPHVTAQGDDQDLGIFPPKAVQGDDEDGLVSLTNLRPGQTAVLTLHATIKGLPEGRLDAWLDFNRDRDWKDAGEQILTKAKVIDGVNTVSFPVPAGSATGQTFLRLRLSAKGGLTPEGPADSGEVDDHAVEILP